MHKFSRYVNFAVLFCFIGIVDQVHSDDVHVELSDSAGNLTYSSLPIWLFPCEVAEGDMFYAVKVDDVLELRCGEPPD